MWTKLSLSESDRRLLLYLPYGLQTGRQSATLHPWQWLHLQRSASSSSTWETIIRTDRLAYVSHSTSVRFSPRLELMNVLQMNSFLPHTNILTTSQPQYITTTWFLFDTRALSKVIIARPAICSSLKITNHCFRSAAPYLWNWLPVELYYELHQLQSPSLLPPITPGSALSLSPFSFMLTCVPARLIP